MEWKDNLFKIDRSSAASMNRLNVLKQIIEKKRIKRIEISRLTRLQTSTLTYIIQDLKALNLIRESAADEKGKQKGVKPNIITLNEEDNFVLGFDVRPKEVRIVVKNLADRIVHREKKAMVFEPEKAVENISGLFQKVKREFADRKILCLGLGVPGVVHAPQNSIILSNLLKVGDFPLGRLVGEKIRCPVFLENNANLAAYGEYVLVYKEKTRNLFYLLFHLDEANPLKETGIGSGIIINGDIYHGDFFAAGEMGDIFDGILMNLKSGNNASFFSRSLPGLLAGGGSEEHARLILELGSRIGAILSHVVNIINPFAVIIGDDAAIEETDFFRSIKTGIRDNLVSFIRERIQINPSSFAEYNVAIGAACLAGRHVLSHEYFHDFIRPRR